jgi:hypothetical protein
MPWRPPAGYDLGGTHMEGADVGVKVPGRRAREEERVACGVEDDVGEEHKGRTVDERACDRRDEAQAEAP